MKIQRFDDVEAFALRVFAHLIMHEAEHNLELGIIEAIRAGRYDEYPPLLLSIEDGDSIEDDDGVLGVAVRTPPHGLLLSAHSTATAAAAVASWLLATDDPVAEIPGVQAEPDVAAAFVDAWHAGGGRQMVIHREERIYRLSAVRAPDPAPPGAMRAIRPEDRSLLVEWFAAFAVDTDDPDPMDPDLAVERPAHSWISLGGAPRLGAGRSTSVDGRA